MKVLLINPVYNRLPSSMEQGKNYYSLGLAVLQTEYRKNNAVCDILDLNYYKDEVLKMPSYDELVRRFVDSYSYNCIGITSFSSNFVNAVLIAEAIKKVNPSILIYMGGAHVSTCAEEVVRTFRFIDFVSIGEGEKTAKFIAAYCNGTISLDNVPNVVYYNGTIVKRTCMAPLLSKCELPTISPDISILGVAKKRLFNKSADIEGGRGCPFNCVFCSTKNFWQRQCRMKPLDIILKEMDQLHQDAGVNHFTITHDLFTSNVDFIKKFCKSMKERRYSWTCSARFDTIDTTLISEMYQSGCKDIFFGIETGSQELQKVINKNLTLSKVDEIVNFCVDNGYTHTISFILGFPFETPVQLDSTLQLIYKYYKSHHTKISTGILTPEVGTKVAIDYHEKIRFDKAYMERNYDYVPLEKEREVVLVNDHPSLFSHFYYIENPYFSIHGLRFIEKALRFLCVNYYLTLGVALLKSSSIIDVIAEIIGQSLYSLNAVDFQNHLETFESDLQRYTSVSEILRDVFEYEHTIKIMKGNAAKVGKDYRILTLRRPYPSLNANEIVTVSPGQYNYIVCAAMDDKQVHKVRLKINYVE